MEKCLFVYGKLSLLDFLLAQKNVLIGLKMHLYMSGENVVIFSLFDNSNEN